MRTALGEICGNPWQLCVLATRVRKSYEPAFGPTSTRQIHLIVDYWLEGI